MKEIQPKSKMKWEFYLVILGLSWTILNLLISIPSIFFWLFDKSMLSGFTYFIFTIYFSIIFYIPILLNIFLLVHATRSKKKRIICLSTVGIILFISPYAYFMVTKLLPKKLTVGYCNQRNETEYDNPWKLDKFECFSSLAEQEKDAKYCTYLRGGQIDQCYYNLSETFFYFNQDLCFLISNPPKKDACYDGHAQYRKDPSPCNQIDAPDEKFLCLSRFENTIESCLRIISPEKKAGCIIDIAKKTKNPKLCEEIHFYKSNCYSSMAEELRDPSLCKYDPYNHSCEERAKMSR